MLTEAVAHWCMNWFYVLYMWFVKDRVQRKQRITWFLTIGLHSWQRSDFITGLWVNCPVLARAASKTIQLSSCHATLFHQKNYSKNNPGLIPSVKIFFLLASLVLKSGVNVWINFIFSLSFMVWPLALVIVGERTKWYVCQGFRWNANNGPIIWGNAFHVCYFGWFQYATSRNKHRNCLNNWLQNSYLQWPENCFLKWQQAIFLYGKNTITDEGSNVLKLFKLLILFKLFYTA